MGQPDKHFLSKLMDLVFAILTLISRLVGLGIVFFFVVLIGIAIWGALTAPPPTPEQQAAADERSKATKQKREQKEQREAELCHMASACKKYDDVRLQCATAGDFQRCLRIKMGDDAGFSGVCSGYDEGAPAQPLPPETPNPAQCFVITLFH